MIHSFLKNTLYLFLLLAFLPACQKDKMTLYKPHYKKPNGEKFYGKSQLNEEQISNISQVLLYYEEDFKIENQEVFVEKELANNWELMYNYTNKSEDQKWLNSHKP